MLLFTIAVTVTAAVLFGIAPAFQSARIDVAPALKGGDGARSARLPFRKGLVVFQVGLSLVVVMGALLFLRSLYGLLSEDTGFARRNVLVASIDLPLNRPDVYSRLLDAMQHLPGVESAALADSAPLGTSMAGTSTCLVTCPGRTSRRRLPG